MLSELPGELAIYSGEAAKRASFLPLNDHGAYLASLQAAMQNANWHESEVLPDSDVADYARFGKHSKQLEKAVDAVLAEEDIFNNVF